jgi:hypothetical protein
MTVRQDILSNFKTTLEAITDFKEVSVDRVTVFDIATAPLPSAFVWSDTAVLISGAIGDETWEWDIVVEFFARDVDMEDLIGKVHLEMRKDYQRGNPNNVMETKLLDINKDILDVDKSLQSSSIRYQITYKHPRGTV